MYITESLTETPVATTFLVLSSVLYNRQIEEFINDSLLISVEIVIKN